MEFEYYGIDIDPYVIAAARARYKEHPNARFISADICSRPFDENYFDEVLLAGTAHHLSDSLFATVLKELHYCLKPGREVHLLDPTLQAKDGWQPKLMRRIDRGRHSRSLDQFLTIIDSLKLFEIGKPSFHTPYGLLIQECDFLHLPLRKRG